MVEIYGSDLSLFSNKVKLGANAIGIEYDFQNMDILAGELQKSEYLEINPTGKIPALKDGEFTLFDSSSIIKYLADKQNSNLYPKDLQSRYLVDKWIEFSSIHIGDSIVKVLFNRKFASLMNIPVNNQSIEDGLNLYKRFVSVVDDQLSKNQYLVGDALSLADVTLLAILDPSEAAGHDITPYGNIVKWRNALKKEKFYTSSFISYEDTLNTIMSGASV